MALAGLDVGTSGTKMVAFDTNGNVLASAHCTYKEYGTDGIREIDPQEVIEAVFNVIKQITKQCHEPIEAFAIASIGESSVCLDENDVSICKSMVTGDKRGIEEVKELINLISSKEIMEITGLPPSEMYALPKYMWQKKHTDVFEHTSKIFYFEDFVGYMLTGKRKVSESLASRSMAYDIRKKQWSKKLLDVVGIKEEQLSTPVPSGTVIGKIKQELVKELGLNKSTVVVTGGHDQICAAFGSGLQHKNQSEDGMGTCEFMVCMIENFEHLDEMMKCDLPCEPYVYADSYLTSVEITTCGVLMNWARDTLLTQVRDECIEKDENFYAIMDELAEKEKITDLLILPQFGSSGPPITNYDAKGLIWGLTVHTTQVQIYRALKESMAYQMRLSCEALQPLGVNFNQVSITGGGAVSDFTAQLRADVFGIDIVSLCNNEAGTLGAMILAGIAIGCYESFEHGIKKAVKIKRVFSPNKENAKIYMQKFMQYKKLHNLMHNF